MDKHEYEVSLNLNMINHIAITEQYIASLEAENANLTEWLACWKESHRIATNELMHLLSDNKALVEQVNVAGVKYERALFWLSQTTDCPSRELLISDCGTKKCTDCWRTWPEKGGQDA